MTSRRPKWRADQVRARHAEMIAGLQLPGTYKRRSLALWASGFQGGASSQQSEGGGFGPGDTRQPKAYPLEAERPGGP